MSNKVYRPTQQDAMSVYVAAAAHQYDLPVEAIDQTDHLYAAEEWLRTGGINDVMFRIINPREVDDSGRLMAPAAICTYGLNGDLWEVEFRDSHREGEDGRPLLVRSEQGRFVVVGKGPRRDYYDGKIIETASSMADAAAYDPTASAAIEAYMLAAAYRRGVRVGTIEKPVSAVEKQPGHFDVYPDDSGSAVACRYDEHERSWLVLLDADSDFGVRVHVGEDGLVVLGFALWM